MEAVPVLPHIEPLPLVRRPAPFSHPDWLFELKYDGFRALAYVDRDSARLVSRNGNAFTMFSDLCENLKQVLPHPVILDGEIACLDDQGRSQFNRLLFRLGIPRFCAFDLVWLDGRDLRDVPLLERKRVLRSIIPQRSPHLLYVDHLKSEGERLFELACAGDLEGIVAKHKHSRYRLDGDGWIKIKNQRYSQIAGRSEFFDQDKERAARESPRVGWAACTHACAALRRSRLRIDKAARVARYVERVYF